MNLKSPYIPLFSLTWLGSKIFRCKNRVYSFSVASWMVLVTSAAFGKGVSPGARMALINLGLSRVSEMTMFGGVSITSLISPSIGMCAKVTSSLEDHRGITTMR